jgi:hypothetical protein
MLSLHRTRWRPFPGAPLPDWVTETQHLRRSLLFPVVRKGSRPKRGNLEGGRMAQAQARAGTEIASIRLTQPGVGTDCVSVFDECAELCVVLPKRD